MVSAIKQYPVKAKISILIPNIVGGDLKNHLFFSKRIKNKLLCSVLHSSTKQVFLFFSSDRSENSLPVFFQYTILHKFAFLVILICMHHFYLNLLYISGFVFFYSILFAQVGFLRNPDLIILVLIFPASFD